MMTTRLRNFGLFTLFIAVLGIGALNAQAETVAVGASTGSDAATSTEINVADVMKDRVLGDPSAPVTVIEYASMTCMHCANFHNTVLPYVKSDLIETGKVKLIYRDFPLDAVALRASMMARCAPEDKYFNLLEVLFANQKRWVGAADPVQAMAKLGKLAGLSDARLSACLRNTDLETEILKSRQNASAAYKVSSTPTFIFNDGAAIESGVIPIEDFKKIVEKVAAAR